MTTEFSNIELALIEPSLTNPRKTFNTAIAAARVQMGIECAKFIEGEEDGLPLETLANGIRALINTNLTTGEMK